MLVGIAIVVTVRVAIAAWRQWRPHKPRAMFLDLTSRERRQMLYHDDQ